MVYVNEEVDASQENDYQESEFALVPQYESNIILDFRTNNAPWENRYDILDKDGQVVQSRGSLTANTIYRDTLALAPGCYTMHFLDSGEDGIAWWANNDGNGYVRLLTPDGLLLLNFEPDYGKDIVHQFTVGYQLGEEDPDVSCVDTTTTVGIFTPDEDWAVSVYPNPAQERFFVDVQLYRAEELTVRIYNTAGQLLSQRVESHFRSGVLNVEAPNGPGLYFVHVQAGKQVRTVPILVE